MRVIVYVEGPADRAALEVLLRDLISDASKRGIGVRFIPLGGKAAILKDAAIRAADHLAENAGDWIFALPDLYPMASYDGTENAHRSFDAMAALLQRRFDVRSGKINLAAYRRHRFRIHCLKYDLEALLLAAPEALRRRLGTRDALKSRWRLPVEDQNDADPPKRVIEGLFSQYKRKKYVDTDDAPWILAHATLSEVLTSCGQRFSPFVGELRAIVEGGAP